MTTGWVLETVVAGFRGRAALFRLEHGQPRLFSSRVLDQDVLDFVAAVWREDGSLQAGRSLWVTAPNRPLLKRLLANGASLAVVPVKSGSRPEGLLYADGADLRQDAVPTLEHLARIAGVALRMPEGPSRVLDGRLLVTPSPDGRHVHRLSRDELLAILEHSEWNIARAARMLGVTRRPVYLRMRRLGIERERIHTACLHTAK